MAIPLQYWTAFCETSTWVSHRFTYVPSTFNLLPTFLHIASLELVTEIYGKLHTFLCHPWAGAMLILSVLFQFFNIYATKANTQITL